MKGLELSKRFYREYGEPMLRAQFPELLGRIATGLLGSGSECFGYDDDLSADHDFEPGFCILLPDEETVDRKAAFALERAYAKLPKEFMGYRRSPLDPVGGNRHGVIRTSDFLRDKTGTADGVLALHDFFFIPEQSLAEVTNGEIFFDGLGEITAVRDRLVYLPEDVRLKKLAGHLLLMGQSGQYNYSRSIARGDSAAAQLSAIEFVKSAIHAIFLLNRTYLPYYKWSFCALRALPRLAELAPTMEHLISSPNDAEQAKIKQDEIEQIVQKIILELHAEGLSETLGEEAERHAYAVNDCVLSPELRNLHILYGV